MYFYVVLSSKKEPIKVALKPELIVKVPSQIAEDCEERSCSYWRK